MDRTNNRGHVLPANLLHIRNLVKVTYHDGGTIVNPLETLQNAGTLVLLTRPGVLIGRTLFRFYDNVLNLGEPLAETLFVLLKKQLLRATHVVHLSLHKHKEVDKGVKHSQTQLKDIQLIIEHKSVHNHILHAIVFSNCIWETEYRLLKLVHLGP